MKSKKGLFGLGNAAMGLLVFGILLVVALTVSSTMQETQTSGTAEYNATSSVISGLSDFTNWIPIIVVVIVAVVIIALVRRIKS